MSEVDIQRLVDNVSDLQKDMAQVGTLVDRLDITIEKLTEVSTTVSQLLAIQGSRLEFQERLQEKMQDLIEKRRQEADTTAKDIYLRIEKNEKEIYTEIEVHKDKVIEKIEELRKTGTNQHNAINDRIGRLEKWMWTLIGGGIVLGFLINKLNVISMLG